MSEKKERLLRWIKLFSYWFIWSKLHKIHTGWNLNRLLNTFLCESESWWSLCISWYWIVHYKNVSFFGAMNLVLDPVTYTHFKRNHSSYLVPLLFKFKINHSRCLVPLPFKLKINHSSYLVPLPFKFKRNHSRYLVLPFKFKRNYSSYLIPLPFIFKTNHSSYLIPLPFKFKRNHSSYLVPVPFKSVCGEGGE